MGELLLTCPQHSPLAALLVITLSGASSLPSTPLSCLSLMLSLVSLLLVVSSSWAVAMFLLTPLKVLQLPPLLFPSLTSLEASLLQRECLTCSSALLTPQSTPTSWAFPLLHSLLLTATLLPMDTPRSTRWATLPLVFAALVPWVVSLLSPLPDLVMLWV